MHIWYASALPMSDTNSQPTHQTETPRTPPAHSTVPETRQEHLILLAAHYSSFQTPNELHAAAALLVKLFITGWFMESFISFILANNGLEVLCPLA